VDKPYAESCDQNRAPILAVLSRLFASAGRVLEIGSGTGQHAVHFADAMPHLVWQTSDRIENHPGILAWLDEAALPNTRPPIDLDVSGPWPAQVYDAVFSANTVHIMSWAEVQSCFKGVASVLVPGGRFALYGPSNYAGEYTSDSNRRFDAWLKQRDPLSGIRDFRDLEQLAESQGLLCVEDIEMPVNNRILVWQRDAA
jgi:cyclopropane fatty-acyl-phospholipid synthase-like methyltransferase